MCIYIYIHVYKLYWVYIVIAVMRTNETGEKSERIIIRVRRQNRFKS